MIFRLPVVQSKDFSIAVLYHCVIFARVKRISKNSTECQWILFYS